MKKFILYLGRWQLSTLTLWPVLEWLGAGLWQTIIANFIGGCIFFFVDRFIFTSETIEMWHLKEGRCDKCGKTGHLWRLVKTKNYDKSTDTPKFFCNKCSKEKQEELQREGIWISRKVIGSPFHID
jgi:hypothetical protein